MAVARYYYYSMSLPLLLLLFFLVHNGAGQYPGQRERERERQPQPQYRERERERERDRQPVPGPAAPGVAPPQYPNGNNQHGSASCTDRRGYPQKCTPEYKNVAFGLEFDVTSTCGLFSPSEYCVQTRTQAAERACDICSARDPRKSHPAAYLTDVTSVDRETWWQSETMYEGIFWPSRGVNLTLDFKKAFDIIHITMKFYSTRPEHLAIYKRTSEDGPWVPFQYFSETCRDFYGLPDLDSIQGSDTSEARPLCTSEFTGDTPLSGGIVQFVTLQGRPSRDNYENSKELNDWVSATSIMITLDKMNTFGDEVFGDEKVLRSYFYAITDITIGGTCKCNGHAKECVKSTGPGGESRLVCRCEHNTDGVDCGKCLPFYMDQPWGRATSTDVHECQACNCNGFSDRCYFDKDLYERTGHGGHCTDCSGNRGGPNCEACKPNHYQRSDGYCIPCNCHINGSRTLQCNSEGECSCQPGVTGEKCDACAAGFYGFSKLGCQECNCNPAGSRNGIPSCDDKGKCFCKANVEGSQCDRCILGTFNLDLENEFGCTPCFCFGHSSVCKSSSASYNQVIIESVFQRGLEKWTAEEAGSKDSIPIQFSSFTQNLGVTAPAHEPVYFLAPERFLRDQRGSYNQYLNFSLRIGEHGPRPSSEDIILEGAGLYVSRPIFAQNSPLPSTRPYDYSIRLHENQEFGWNPNRTTKEFMTILSNLTAIKIRATYTSRGVGFLDNVKLKTARIGSTGASAPWVESCTCPSEYIGEFCEQCADGWTKNGKGPLDRCVPCECHGHAEVLQGSTPSGEIYNYTSCDPKTGQCICEHNTYGDNCEKCVKGYYGNARNGKAEDCKECPCPLINGTRGACIEIPDDSVSKTSVVCLACPEGYAGPTCQSCSDSYYFNVSTSTCEQCECSGNIDPNAVGNCDRTTGECLKCIYNTGGPRCEKCLPLYYGDALTKGDCKPCACNSLGSTPTFDNRLYCQQATGQCKCKENVAGRQCDHCEAGFWNLESGTGCKDCMCDSIGSVNGTCNPESGQCTCRDGIVGLTCKECAPNHYGFSTEGCKPCNCDYIGSLSLQCDLETGQCLCRDNVEGRTCDRCKDNKWNRQAGCVDCPDCYNLVLDAVSSHREKLNEMNEHLEKIRNAPTVVNDREFEMKLQQVQQRVNKLWTDARSATGSDEKSFIDQINELRDKLNALVGIREQINETLEQCLVNAEESNGNLTSVERTVDRASENLKSAQRFLETEGKDALRQAEEKSQEYGHQNSILSELAREARLLADEHEEDAGAIEKIAQDALNTTTTAHELARKSIRQQVEASEESKLLLKSIQQLEEEVRSTQAKAKESLEKAKEAYDDALNLFQDANSLTLPTVDLEAVKNDALRARDDAIRLQESVSNLVNQRQVLLREAEEEAKETRGRLNSAVKHQQTAESLMADLDVAKADAEKARVQSENTFKEAQEIYNTLQDFNRNVEESKEKAQLAEGKVSNIVGLIAQVEAETRDNENDLYRAKQSASRALADANEAKRIAEKASQDADTIRVECNETKIQANTLRDETSTITRQIAEAANRLANTESKVGDDDSKVQTALDNAAEAQSTARNAHEKVQNALNSVRDIKLALDNLPDINEVGLDGLEEKIAQVEKQFNDARLDEKLGELRTARNRQTSWLKSYENDLAMLRKEVEENIKEITDSLPPDTRCWKRTRLEP